MKLSLLFENDELKSGMDEWLRELEERDREKQAKSNLARQTKSDSREQEKLERSRSATIQSKADKLKKARAGLDAFDRLLAKGALKKAGIVLPKPQVREVRNSIEKAPIWPNPNESSEEFEERILDTINSMMTGS